jgi:serine protease inhibitor
MMRTITLGVLLFAVSFASVACNSKPAPDVAMTTAPTGTWVGEGNDYGLEIQEGGAIRLTRGEQESFGTWESEGTSAIKATFDGKSYSMPFSRKDLSLTITLPGETSPSKFSQM